MNRYIIQERSLIAKGSKSDLPTSKNQIRHIFHLFSWWYKIRSTLSQSSFDTTSLYWMVAGDRCLLLGSHTSWIPSPQKQGKQRHTHTRTGRDRFAIRNGFYTFCVIFLSCEYRGSQALPPQKSITKLLLTSIGPKCHLQSLLYSSHFQVFMVQNKQKKDVKPYL